ncbi:MAG TPA: ABC transporter permease [Aeromicrobium sp.]|nr:ABC transporter permease [Aeromicrobium sp.]
MNGRPETDRPENGRMAPWRIVAEHEVSTQLRQKSVRISAAVMVLGVIAVIVLSSIFGDKPSTYDVAVTDAQTSAVVDQASQALDEADEGATITARTAESEQSAEELVTAGEVDAALVPSADGYVIVGDRDISSELSAALATAVQSTVVGANAEALGVDLTALQAGATVEHRLLDPDAQNAGARQLMSFVMLLLFYITAITFGITIAQSVVQEKESRIVEILAAAVPTRSLLWGKVLGNSLLAFGQIGLVIVAALVTLRLTGFDDLFAVAGSTMGWYALFFVLGFVAMAGLWAIAGSLASRQTDLQSTTMPANLLLFAPYMIAVAAGEGVKTVFSMLPITSAMLMPSRMAEGSVPWWHLLVAVVANVIAIVVTVRIAARVYERTLMRTERRLSFREALRLSD